MKIPNISGGSKEEARGARVPLIFRPGPKTFFLKTVPPPPLSQGLGSGTEYCLPFIHLLYVLWCVVAQFYPWFKFYFLLFLVMVMYDSEFETKGNKI